MKKTTIYFLAFISLSFGSFAKNKDPRMERFEDFIKKENQVKEANHPRLLFSQSDIPLIRKKAKEEYFKNYVSDLLEYADICIKRNPDNAFFPFTENPNYQTISETLVMAYILTGEKKYSRKAIELSKTFMKNHYKKVPVRDSGKFIGHLQNGNSVSFVLNTVAVVYDSLYHEMTPEERFEIRKGLAYFCKVVYEMSIKEEYGLGFHKNYRAGQMGALGLACLVLKGETFFEVHQWLDKAKRLSLAWCNVAIKPDGVYPEGVTYLYYMLRNQLLFFEALKREEKIDYFARTNLKNSLIWTLWSSLPWNYEFDNFSDGRYQTRMHDMPYILQANYPGYGDYFIYKAYGLKLRYRSNPWAILFGKKPDLNNFNPEKKLGLAKLFPFGGIAGFRNAWNKDSMLLLSYATDYEYAAHSQADRGQFNIYAYEYKWAIDSGYGNDAKIENSATPSDAHNIVLIDGKGEAFDPTMRQSGTFSDIVDFYKDKNIGFVKIDQKQAYDFNIRYHYVNKIKYNEVEKAFRNILFINGGKTPPYALIYDDIQKDSKPHNFTWQMHTAPGNTVEIKSGGGVIKPLSFSSKALLVDGTGAWDNFKDAGFNIIRHHAGNAIFKIDVPEEGEYILWGLARGRPYMNGNVELLVNEKFAGRFHLGQERDFCWVKFTLNKKKMHKPELIMLKRGENILHFRELFSGYEAAKFLLTKNAGFIPEGFVPDEKNSIVFGMESLIKKDFAEIKNVDIAPDVECMLEVLHPQDCKIENDFYQASNSTVHPRILIKAEAVNPDFLTFIYPKKNSMERPKIARFDSGKFIHSIILWENVEDHIYVRLNSSPIESGKVETDGKILFLRFDRKDKKLINGFVSEAKSLKIDGIEKIESGSSETTGIN